MMTETPTWEGAARYVEKWKSGKEPKWLVLYRDGECVGKFTSLSVGADGAECKGSETRTLRCAQLDLTKHDKESMREYAKYLQEEYECLRHNKNSAKNLAAKTPGVSVLYDSGNGYWRSLLFTLYKYCEFVRTGKDTMVVGSTRRNPQKCNFVSDQEPTAVAFRESPYFQPASATPIEPTAMTLLVAPSHMNVEIETLVEPVGVTLAVLSTPDTRVALPCPASPSYSVSTEILETRNYDDETLDRLIQTTNDPKVVLEYENRIRDFKAGLTTNGISHAHIKEVYLGDIAALGNMSKGISTGALEAKLDGIFAKMSPSEYNSGSWHGVEDWYEEDPSGKKKYIPKSIPGVKNSHFSTRAASIDHIVPAAYSIFNHPRFYMMVHARVNQHLGISIPETRLGCGMSRSVLRRIHVIVKKFQRDNAKVIDTFYSTLTPIVAYT